MFSSAWTPPEDYKKRRKDGYIYVPEYPNEGNLNHNLIMQSVDFHGKLLLKKLPESLINHLPICEVSNLDYIDPSFKEFHKRTSIISKYEEANNELLDFICEKSPWIFKTKSISDTDFNSWRNFKWKNYITLDRYKCLPPLEYFLKVGPDVCEQEFYKSVAAGDILFGKVIDYCAGDTHILQIIATGGHHHRNLLGTNIKAELKLSDMSLDKTLHPDQIEVVSGRKRWKINTLLTVEVLQTPNIIEGRINPEETIRVNTKSIVLEKTYPNCIHHKFLLGPCDTENSSNEYPSVLKSIEDNEVHSYNEDLMKLKINVNTKCQSIASMGRCLDVHHRLNHSLMNSTDNSCLSWNKSVPVRQTQIDNWMKELRKNKSLLDNAHIIDVMMEVFKEDPMSVHMIMNRAILNKYLSRYKEALRDINLLKIAEPRKFLLETEPTKSRYFEIILEYARESEITYNFRESEKLYKKCIEMYPENVEIKETIERIKELVSPDGKDHDVEELENLLELTESIRKSVQELSDLTLYHLPEKLLENLLENGLVKRIDIADGYQCIVCKIFVVTANIYEHIRGNKHYCIIKELSDEPYIESIREDIKVGLKSGLYKKKCKPKKGKKPRYECTLCQVTTTSIGNKGGLESHIDSLNHQFKLKDNIMEGLEEPLKEAIILGVVKADLTKANKYHCVPCDIGFPVPNNATAHIVGKKHRKKVEMEEKNQRPLQAAMDLGDIIFKHSPELITKYHCVPCNVDLTDEDGALNHIKGKKHQLQEYYKVSCFSPETQKMIGSTDKLECHESPHPVSQKNFSGANNEPIGQERHHPVSQKNFSGANNEPIGQERHRPVSKNNYTGANDEPLGHKKQSDYRPETIIDYAHEKQSNYRPETVIDYGHQPSAAIQDNFDVQAHEVIELEENELNEYHPSATKTLFIGNLEKEITAEYITKHFEQFGKIIEIDIQKHNVSVFAYCHYSDIRSVVHAMRIMDGEHIGANRIKLGFGKSKTTKCVWIGGVEESISEAQLFEQFSQFGPVISTHVDKEKGHALICYDIEKYASNAVMEMRGRMLNGKKLQIDFASWECQLDFLDQLSHNVLPTTSMQRTEPIQPTISSDITMSLDLRSETAAELKSVMSSMSAEQRKMFEQRLSERMKSIEQDIEEAFAEPSAVVSTNSEWGESRKRKDLAEDQETTYLVDFARKKTKK